MRAIEGVHAPAATSCNGGLPVRDRFRRQWAFKACTKSHLALRDINPDAVSDSLAKPETRPKQTGLRQSPDPAWQVLSKEMTTLNLWSILLLRTLT